MEIDNGTIKRSDAERDLPEFVLAILDAARRGIDYHTGNPMTREQVIKRFANFGLASPFSQ